MYMEISCTKKPRLADLVVMWDDGPFRSVLHRLSIIHATRYEIQYEVEQVEFPDAASDPRGRPVLKTDRNDPYVPDPDLARNEGA